MGRRSQIDRAAVLRALFGPFKRGEYVVQWSFFGLVFAAGPRQFSVVWQSGQVTRHAQDYRGFRRACAGSWNHDAAYRRRVQADLAKELARVQSRLV